MKEGLRKLPLPMPQQALDEAHARLLATAKRTLRTQSFGASRPAELTSAASETRTALADANFVASQHACDEAWAKCEAAVRAGRVAWLPSTARFAARIGACNATLGACVGPAAAHFHETLLPRLAAEGAAEYTESYRERLHRALVVGSVTGVLVFRLLLRSALLEMLCAIVFVGVELLPALLPFGAGSAWLWENAYVRRAVEVYELLVYNQVWDLEYLLPLLALGVPALVCACRVRRRRLGGGASGASLAQVVVESAKEKDHAKDR